MADSQAQVFDVNLTGGVVTIADFNPYAVINWILAISLFMA